MINIMLLLLNLNLIFIFVACFLSSFNCNNQVEALQLELDGYIAADCPLCGYVMIRSLSMPLITPEDSEEAKAWAL